MSAKAVKTSHKIKKGQSDASDVPAPQHSVVIGLSAVIVTVESETPFVLVVERKDTKARKKSYGLPFGPFDPDLHRTLEIGLRTWVEEQTYLHLGYVEQLYTFGDRGRSDIGASGDSRIISVGYLALTREAPELSAPDNVWHNWYRYFPWEDWRDHKPEILEKKIEPALRRWAGKETDKAIKRQRRDRTRLCFGLDGMPWDEEKVLERYELLYEAGLVSEVQRDQVLPVDEQRGSGQAMMSDQRRILATGMGRLRSKLKYRPVVFELMPPVFTLLNLQRTVEAISGVHLHKQNFRRLVEKSGLVEGTGKKTTQTAGRPAEEFRFRREVMRERPAPGFRVRSSLRS